MSGAKQLISVQPDELKFRVELEKQSFCDLKVSNNTENHVAFKVKTTSPKKYFVRPNTGVINPWDSCVIRVTLQAQRQYPLDMQCKDKFLLQSTIVPSNSDTDSLPADTFNKDSGRALEECKLRVVYVSPNSADDDSVRNVKGSPEKATESSNIEDNQMVRRLKEERDAAVQETQQLQQELEMMQKRKTRRGGSGFSIMFAIFVALIGLLIGFFLSYSLAPPSSPSPVE